MWTNREIVNIEELYQLKHDHLLPSKKKKRKATISTKRNKEKVYSVYKKKEELSTDAWFNQISVHNRERLVQSTSMCTYPLSAGGLSLLPNFQKGVGLTGSQFFEGGC